MFYRTVIILLLLSIFSGGIHAASSEVNEIKLLLGGRQVDPGGRARLLDRVVYVPLSVLNNLGAKWESDGQLKRSGQNVKITPNKGDAFQHAVKVKDGVSMLPICEIAEKLGFTAEWNEDAKTVNLWSRIDSIEFDGSRLKVSTFHPVDCEVIWGKWANKLIIDLRGAQASPTTEIKNSTSVPIRTGIHDDRGVGRIVLDMPNAVTHRVNSGKKASDIDITVSGLRPEPGVPGEEGKLQPPVVVPLPPVTVTDISFKKQGSQHLQVEISASGPAKSLTYLFRDPDRLVVDLSRAVLADKFEDVQVRNEILRSICVEQKDETTVRVAMDLTRVVGYDLRWDDVMNKAVVTLELPKGAGGLLSQRVIVIDAGHGGQDPGARGFNGSLEKTTNLSIATRVQRLLSEAGAAALMTRSSDVSLSLADRANFAARNSADLFISIHSNSCPKPASISGIETFYHGGNRSGRALAQCIHDEMIKVAGLPDRKIKADTTRFKTGFGVLRGTSNVGIPGALLEVGFINHPGDERKITDPEFQQGIARAIVRGLKIYVEGNSTQAALPEEPVGGFQESIVVPPVVTEASVPVGAGPKRPGVN